jgi:hypothetical protein
MPHQYVSDNALVGGGIFPTYRFGQKHSFFQKLAQNWHQQKDTCKWSCKCLIWFKLET